MIAFLCALNEWLLTQPRFVRKCSVSGYLRIGGEVYGPDQWQLFYDPDEDHLYIVRVLGSLVTTI